MNGSSFSHLDKSISFRKLLLKEAGVRFQPVDGTFEITSRCNLSCGMCYIHNSLVDSSSELSADVWVNLGKSAADAGMVFLLLTGGEVFARADFFHLYLPLTRLGLYLSVYTNGTLVTREIADRLSESPPHCIEITLYGSTQETYESMTGVKGSFSRCMKGIENLLSSGISTLKLKSTLTQINYRELQEMMNLSNSLGLDFTSSWLLTQNRSHAAPSLDKFRLSTDQLRSIESFYKDNGYPKAKNLIGNAKADKSAANPGDAFYCNAGKSSFSITPEGLMTPCNSISALHSHPLQSGFLKAWEELRQKMQAVPKSPTCADTSCQYYEFCPWCPANGFVETGSYTDPVPYFCEMARTRHAFWNSP